MAKTQQLVRKLDILAGLQQKTGFSPSGGTGETHLINSMGHPLTIKVHLDITIHQVAPAGKNPAATLRPYRSSTLSRPRRRPVKVLTLRMASRAPSTYGRALLPESCRRVSFWSGMPKMISTEIV